jgi:Protein of unknown function (DUF1553)/Protein of unknown function (DUF1549)/Planctomycete cytochrome C
MRFLLTALLFPVLFTPGSLAAEVDYLRDIKPIFKERCFSCHSAVRTKAKLRLDAASLIRKGGRHGAIIVPGKPNESLLIEAVVGRDRPRMPPEQEGKGLTPQQISLLREWIASGMRMPNEPVPGDPRKHWAFQPPVRAPVPAIPGVRNPIDVFLAAAREKHGLRANPPADRALLLRRVYLDLIGLPPTRQELRAFLSDSSPDAYERVVDRLLASPRYGERWGRHWMDVWRYSDPFGNGAEYRYSHWHIWRWRDWIVQSLNEDKTYDRMIQEMLAGDELAPADRDTLRATGYLARNWYKFNRTAWIQDTVEHTAAGFLGITLRCARCHDHKYDPIAQQEYYRFRAFFEPHDIRIDLVPGQPDKLKDGVARAFDARPEAPTYLFRRGDERNPDTSRPLTPGVPAVLGGELAVKPVRFTPRDFVEALEPAAREALRLARADLAAAEKSVKQTADTVVAARRRLELLTAHGVAHAEDKKPAEVKPVAFLHDNFASARPDVWKVIRGKWAWEKGRLVCKAPSTFATVSTSKVHPAALMGRVRYRTTGGSIGSVGLSYDVAGENYQAIYINAGKGSAVRAFHRVAGKDTYPAEGIVPHPVKFGEEVTLDFAVRGNLLNTWVNGKLRNVYRLPIARRPGGFSLWAHAATAEFIELRLDELPGSVTLADRPPAAHTAADRPSPLDGPVILTKADAEKALKQAEADATLAGKHRQVALALVAAVEARREAERARYAEPVDQSRARVLALAAGKAERGAAALKAAEEILRAEQTVQQAKRSGIAGPAGKKALADAERKLATARKALTAAEAATSREDPTYTPLIKVELAGSTGRRLALARWITDRTNPLTARVAVNHIWMRHFGKPLVPTVANFGLAGKPPTHPELLDWLAVEFMDRGWSLKTLHRLVVTSEAYRLSSHASTEGLRADPENVYLWRLAPRRMEGEVVRDSILALSGRLDQTMGGPILDQKLGQTSRRRSLYFRFNTEYKMPFLDQFDPASPTECYERRDSVIPQQALALSNSVLALENSRVLARKLSAAAPRPADFVAAAFEQVLGRPPADAERDRCQRFLREQTKALREPGKLTPFPAGLNPATPPSADPAQRARENLIQVLFNHNDFVTIR